MTESDENALFSQSEVAHLTATWAVFRPGISDAGMDVFVNFFGEFPEHHRLFPKAAGVRLDRLRATPTFRKHTDAVMMAVTALVDNAGDSSTVLPLLARLGGFHARNQVPAQALLDFKASFLHWLRQNLGTRGKPATMASWDKLMTLLVAKLIEGMTLEPLSGLSVGSTNATEQSPILPIGKEGTALISQSQSTKQGTPLALQSQSTIERTPLASQSQSNRQRTPLAVQSKTSVKVSKPVDSQSKASRQQDKPK